MNSEKIDNRLEGLDTIPIRWINIIEEYFTSNTKYVENLKDQILNKNKAYPFIKLKLKEIIAFNEGLYSYIKKKPEDVLEMLYNVLLNMARFDIEVKDFLGKSEICKFEAIHLSFDLDEIEDNIALYDNFSLGTKSYVNKLIRIRARFLDLQLFREDTATIITYKCLLCGAKINIPQFKGKRGKYRKPKFCTNRACKANAYADFGEEEVTQYYEAGTFRIGDIDFSKQIEKECYTTINFDYFSEKTENINLNDIIEILGIIKLDTSEVGTKIQDQKIHEYIKVIDFNPIELRVTDPEIIKTLYKQFEEDRNYHHQILDSIHPLTKEIYTFRLFKIILLLGLVSSDSWDTIIKKRCSINSIIGSVPGLFKGSITEDFRELLGANNVGKMSGYGMTPAGLIPTSQRGKEKDFKVRYGALAYYNKKYLVIDEAYSLLKNKGLIEPIKFLEDGSYHRGTDGSVLHAEWKLSVSFFLNYSQNEEQSEGYNYDLSLRRNLGGVQESVLQRFDLHYSMGYLPTQINDVIEERMLLREEGDINVNYLYNYINEVKRLYQIQKFSPSMKKKLRGYIKLLRVRRGLNKQHPREFRTLQRIVCGISAIRFKTEVDESDFMYLQRHLVDLMIPFFGYAEIKRLKLHNIDMIEIFQNTFKLLTEVHKLIPIHDHISLIRQFLEAHYFLEQDGMIKGLDDYMPGKVSLENNKYRKLLDNPDNIRFIENLGYSIGKMNNKTHYINKEKLEIDVLDYIRQVFKDCKNNPLEEKSLLQVLEVKIPYERELIQNTITNLTKKGILVKAKSNLLKIIK